MNSLLNQRPQIDKYKHSGIYELKFNTYARVYVGQSGREIKIRCQEHHTYIKQNNAKSAYALHVLNNQHEYGTMTDNMRLLKTCNKG
ncbi:hypothetical protein Cfor_10511 [Coptotermes formosanus]|jgi:hypothetical protein|uniref:GIY-YIG domain-containing protein n=1 Tax=Coptotermes formosanus TaxID=36987 RepID=A0A6L2PDF7_COPFO|nr:hypothetical protein Cfor_10511 [Coptotermes formosanus]